MKAVITIIIIAVVAFGGYKLWEYWDTTQQQKTLSETKTGVNPQSLQGLPYQLENKLQEAQAKGPEAFKEFIDMIKKSPAVRDPRLAWIELDYVMMIAAKDPVEAKRTFAKVKERTPADSPVYERIKSLEKSFE